MLAIEPNPFTLRFLRRNLALRKSVLLHLVPYAISDVEGATAFYPGGQGRSAYSGLIKGDATGQSTEVSTLTLNRVFREHGIALADLVKLDVEGSEIAVLRGAFESIAEGKLPVLMVEFTEQNLQRCGLSTKDLYAELTSLGYAVCRFNEQKLELEPVEYTGPVWYDNYFAVNN